MGKFLGGCFKSKKDRVLDILDTFLGQTVDTGSKIVLSEYDQEIPQPKIFP